MLGSGKEARKDQRDSYVLNDSFVLADMNEGNEGNDTDSFSSIGVCYKSLSHSSTSFFQFTPPPTAPKATYKQTRNFETMRRSFPCLLTELSFLNVRSVRGRGDRSEAKDNGKSSPSLLEDEETVSSINSYLRPEFLSRRIQTLDNVPFPTGDVYVLNTSI